MQLIHRGGDDLNVAPSICYWCCNSLERLCCKAKCGHTKWWIVSQICRSDLFWLERSKRLGGKTEVWKTDCESKVKTNLCISYRIPHSFVRAYALVLRYKTGILVSVLAKQRKRQLSGDLFRSASVIK